MCVRSVLTLLAGTVALAATGEAFHLFPADLSMPISWLWIPLFGGTVFVNAFGLAAITLMVPWEIMTALTEKRTKQKVAGNTGLDAISDEMATTDPSFATGRIA